MSAKKRMLVLALAAAGAPLAPAVAAHRFTLDCAGEKRIDQEAAEMRTSIYIDLEHGIFCEDTCDQVASIFNVSADGRSIVLTSENLFINGSKEESVDLGDKSYRLRLYMNGGIRRTISADFKCNIRNGITPAIRERLSHASNQ